jgi:hypothetical protein
MGFFDTYEDSSGVNFVKKEEKAELIASGTPLQVVKVVDRKAGKFGPEYLLVFELEGETRGLSFQKESVESRDEFFRALIAWLDEGNEAPVVALTEVGNSVLIVEAVV